MRDWWRYIKLRWWLRSLLATYNLRRRAFWYCFMAWLVMFMAREIAPLLVAVGLEEVDEANEKIRILERGADNFEQDWCNMMNEGPCVTMTKDEYDRWFGDG